MEPSPSSPLRAPRREFLKTLAASSTVPFFASLFAQDQAANSDEKPLKLGILSAASYGRPGSERQPGSYHGTSFSTIFNGWDEEKSKDLKGVFVKSATRIPNAKITKIWDPQVEAAKLLAAACNIDTVAATPEDCCEDVDAVILVDDGSGEQWKHAEYPLKKGIPVFCDKPLAMNVKDAQTVAKWAEASGTPLMSASSLRFVPDILKLKEELPQLGNIHTATVVCANDLIYYGIHALSMAYAVFGSGAVSVHNVGKPESAVARVRFQNDLDVVLLVGDAGRMSGGFQINVYGSKGWKSVTPDLKDLYVYLLEAFLRLVRHGEVSVPVKEEVELIAALQAAELSLKEGREIALEELFKA